jgi:hypothetical protein
MNHLGIKFPLPTPAQPVAARELTVVTNGQGRTYTLPGSALFSDELIFTAEDTYAVSLVDIDANGNRSVPSPAFHGNVADDLRPDRPGEIGPVVPAGKRFLNDADAAQARAQAAAKAADDLKAAEARNAAQAKADADRAAAHAKIDADAAAKKAAVPAPSPAQPAPVTGPK